jgi:molybdate transport system ATP-binding protein
MSAAFFFGRGQATLTHDAGQAILLSPRSASERFIGVELRAVRLRLEPRLVLRDLDWRIRPGERWVLLGPNGAGKTQLLKLLAGDVWPSPHPGSARLYRWRGQVLHEPQELKAEIAYVGAERQDRYQHYEWNHSVQAVIGTGLYRTEIPLDPLSAQDRARIARLLRRCGLAGLARRRFLTLSYGERRLVLLARALAARPKLLLLDEIFNGLDVRNHARMQRLLAAWSRSGLPWVLSAHRLQDLPANATHLCRLERGQIVEQVSLTRQRRGALRLLADAPGPAPAVLASPLTRPRRSAGVAARAAAPVLIALSRATIWREQRAVLRGLTLQIRRGECWVVHGPNGSGKSSLLQTLYGDLGVAHGGSIRRAGVERGTPLWRFQRRVGLIAPELQVLQPRAERALELVVSGLHASIGLDARPGRTQRLAALRSLRRLGAGALAARRARTLSYGQLRRVLFARALVREPDILLLDEPYAGLEARTRAALRALVDAYVDSGVTVVIASHHRDEWPHAASHELELAVARVRYCGPLRASPRRA